MLAEFERHNRYIPSKTEVDDYLAALRDGEGSRPLLAPYPSRLSFFVSQRRMDNREWCVATGDRSGTHRVFKFFSLCFTCCPTLRGSVR
ncbi:hypothetical protein EXIGLDRAFT_728629 [Exidia glandulosa HHB12029]|uniref:Uncharacterized protein n=1 Tax=Exidia glandulosa HHB12029 TaxID=1314781 RepID=A0A165Q5Q4_EXIGL|nr:hypothetical protein EXIGLDRAFT_728629 [Exidia glandulosa HHB12029]